MDWNQVGAIAEIVAALGVIVSLGYVALQVRQNTFALRSAAMNEATNQAARLYGAMAADADLAMVFVRGLRSQEQLSEAEMAQFMSYLLSMMFTMQNWHEQTKARLLEDSLLSSFSRIITSIGNTKGFQFFWGIRAHIYTTEFRAYVETLMASAPQPEYRPMGVASKL